MLFRSHLVRVSSPVEAGFSSPIRILYISGAGMLRMALTLSVKLMNSCLSFPLKRDRFFTAIVALLESPIFYMNGSSILRLYFRILLQL